MYPHHIRLRGPWECTVPDAAPHRATVPWRAHDGTAGDAVLTRKFGYPGRIDSHERVWLTIAQVLGQVAVAVNGERIGEARDGPFAADVTPLLKAHNRLELHLRGKEIGEVGLEIRAAAYFQEVQARRQGAELSVHGRVVGTSEGPLELYVLVDGRHAHYQAISAGEAFQVALSEAGQKVRVDLVNVATVWDRVDLDP